jgi:PKHD-type hydroxylase
MEALVNESIVVVKKAFDLDFCNFLHNMPVEDTGVIGDNVVDTQIRKSNVKFLQGQLRYPQVYQPLYDFVAAVNKEHFGFELDYLQSPQLTEYDEKYAGEYKPHKDTSIPNQFGLQRKLSIVVQLTPSDCYEGGELIFPEQPEYLPSITKEQGTCIAFPSYLLHGVTPVTKGKRKSLVTWVEGPVFR